MTPPRNSDATVIGAVAYDPKVVTIWEGFVHWFAQRGVALDYILYSNYETQVDAHLAGEIDLAWNSPLAWIRTRRLAEADGRTAEPVVMRDTDQDLTSVVLVRPDNDLTSVADLAGRRVATGAPDSPQSTLIPLAHLNHEGLPLHAYEHRCLDQARGKHGDHLIGERLAIEALVAGDADAACVLDASHLTFAKEGLFAPDAIRVLSRTAPYDHCVMTALDGDLDPDQLCQLTDEFLAMSFDDPDARRLLELEGLTQWRVGRTSGFGQLDAAVDLLGI
jgi:phosphonate transport system substrate-binding protein